MSAPLCQIHVFGCPCGHTYASFAVLHTFQLFDGETLYYRQSLQWKELKLRDSICK